MIKLIKLCFLTVFIISSLSIKSFTQPACGTDELHQHMLQTNSLYQSNFQNVQKAVQNIVEFEYDQHSRQTYTIPIVVHIIHNGEAVGTGSNLSNNHIYDAIDGLNDRFSNAIGNGVGTGIEFCLATRDPNGNSTNGINRVNGASIQNYTANGIQMPGSTCNGANDITIKDLSKWPVLDYYNIWVVNKICGGWAGYAYYPWGGAYDGAVMASGSMNYNSRTLAHEVAHGLYLAHTFNNDGGNSFCPANSDCLTQGDWVCDTPPHKSGDCSTVNPCTGSGNWDNSRYNYMSYCFTQAHLARFTEGQKARMRATLQTFPRANLLDNGKCGQSDIPEPPIDPEVVCDNISFTSAVAGTLHPNSSTNQNALLTDNGNNDRILISGTGNIGLAFGKSELCEIELRFGWKNGNNWGSPVQNFNINVYQKSTLMNSIQIRSNSQTERTIQLNEIADSISVEFIDNTDNRVRYLSLNGELLEEDQTTDPPVTTCQDFSYNGSLHGTLHFSNDATVLQTDNDNPDRIVFIGKGTIGMSFTEKQLCEIELGFGYYNSNNWNNEVRDFDIRVFRNNTLQSSTQIRSNTLTERSVLLSETADSVSITFLDEPYNRIRYINLVGKSAEDVEPPNVCYVDYSALDFIQSGWSQSSHISCNNDNSTYLFNTHQKSNNLQATLPINETGTFKIYMRSRGGADRSDNVHVAVDNQTFSWNQKNKNCAYELVGIVTNPGTLTVSTVNTGNDYTIIDAVRIEHVDCPSALQMQSTVLPTGKVSYFNLMGQKIDFESVPRGIYIMIDEYNNAHKIWKDY